VKPFPIPSQPTPKKPTLKPKFLAAKCGLGEKTQKPNVTTRKRESKTTIKLIERNLKVTQKAKFNNFDCLKFVEMTFCY
jgi:hypothetical protein